MVSVCTRPSLGGKVVAKVGLPANVISGMVAVSRDASGEATSAEMRTVDIQVNTGRAPNASIIQDIMDRMINRTSIQLSKFGPVTTKGKNGLRAGEWTALTDVEGAWKKVINVQFRSLEELRKFHSLANGRNIDLGDGSKHITVFPRGGSG